MPESPEIARQAQVGPEDEAGPKHQGRVVERPRGLFLVGGVVKQLITTDDAHVVREHLSSLLQVKNLVVFLGSGASFHLGSPQTRNLTNQTVLELITKSGGEPSDADAELLTVINPTDNGDLEQLLNGLQLAASLARQAGQDSVSIGAGQAAKGYPKEQVEGLRRSINRALAEACRLPSDLAALESPFDVDPFRAHRTFLSRMVRSRRSNLARPSIFTTNYDLVIERALDQLGYPYIDGFSGTVDRRLNLAHYGLDFHRVETTTQSVVARAEGAVYLHKVHGSLNWRSSVERDALTGLESLEVKQSADGFVGDELVLIYPTAAKEADSLAYPYSDLLRLLGDAVQQDDTAVLAVGYGFADPHINRLLLRSLASNPALNVFVADPKAVLSDDDLAAVTDNSDNLGKALSDTGANPKSTAIAALAAAADSRIAVLTGDLGKFSELAELMPDTSTHGSVGPPTAITSLIEALERAASGAVPPLPGIDAV
ncbi:SIR2 family protein [Mycobacterium sp. PSTR-4-N]|uniref:SIR2 family protein n=1 Tax=Mycobacterium sp. PSTR-4-N TaxID=2917745 RepID=UPI001F151E5E|nr:SIR2 family protein [Mycobacterium sp. PSTR-4-N]MCG7594579.1 SIR2 family protein [Mycobacterium sp. PSTR-4-N]